MSYRQLRARRVLSRFNNVLLTPAGEYAESRSMALAPFWFSTEHQWKVQKLHSSHAKMTLECHIFVWKTLGYFSPLLVTKSYHEER